MNGPLAITAAAAAPPTGGPLAATRLPIPRYLTQAYWWAYVHPKAVQLFEREWLVNAILFGHYGRLRDAALAELGSVVHGRTLQVACVYGNLTQRLQERLAPDARLDVVDVLPIQLRNLRRKLPADARVALWHGDASMLACADASYDQALLFFLLHEQPDAVRRATLAEALRVVKPGGKVVIVDYHRPSAWHPMRPLMRLVFRHLEPYAMALWQHETESLHARGRCAQTRCASAPGSVACTRCWCCASRANMLEDTAVDVAIVGAGGAGLRAAIAIAQSHPTLRVALISKVYPMRSHTVAAEGGAAAVTQAHDSLEAHFHDTVAGGDWLCEQDVVDYFVAHAHDELVQMEHWGCPWSRTADGHANVRAFGGMAIERTWFAADKTGFHMLHTLFQTSMKYPSIRRFDEHFCIDLVVDEGRVQGVVAIDIASGEFHLIQAKSVIIATGGAGRVFRENTNGGIVTGDGMALAYRHGVPLRDMEFVQYHPTCMPGTGLLFTEACRGEGGFLLNRFGYRYLQDYGLGPAEPQPRNKAMELGPRDRLSQAYWHEKQKGRTIAGPHGAVVHLDLRHLGGPGCASGCRKSTNSPCSTWAWTRRRRRFRCCPRCTTPWAESSPTAEPRRRCRGCSRWVNVRVSGSTARTDSAQTR